MKNLLSSDSNFHTKRNIHIQILFREFKNDFLECTLEYNLKYKLDSIYFIEQGSVVLMNGNRIFSVLKAPNFIGVNYMLENNINISNISFLISKGSQIKKVGISTCRQIISKKKLHESVNLLLANVLYNLFDLSILTYHPDAYDRVKLSLKFYQKYNYTLKNLISVSSFIMNYTQLSKSRTMFILSELKKGGYIYTSKDGLEILKTLPNKF